MSVRTILIVVAAVTAAVVAILAATVIIRFAIIVTRFALFLPGFLPFLEIGQHAKIVIGELIVIFGIHAVAIMLRILRHLLEFIEHLRSIAACPVIDPVLMIDTATIVVLAIVAAAPAPAVILTIIHIC